MSTPRLNKLTPAEERWLAEQRTKWVPLSERQALIIRAAFRESSQEFKAEGEVA